MDGLVGKLGWSADRDVLSLMLVFAETATQMIETIWPLSILTCGMDAALGTKQDNLIGLRTFVVEVLKRSKTSYSTLQVAMYYLILIQASLPKLNFTMEQPDDSPARRAMQCGRRMFLAALILASKYLQDRNFSARAWSKISGLQAEEINANEMTFLLAVEWKLHITEKVFSRWTEVVLRHSPSANVNGTPRSRPLSTRPWKSLVPLLTPDLDCIDDLDLGDAQYDSGYDSPGSMASPPSVSEHDDVPILSRSNDPTPTPANPFAVPQAPASVPYDSYQPTTLPPLPRMVQLPTPQLTPQTATFCTPAVSASGLRPRGPSMCYAMSQIQSSDVNRITMDHTSEWKPRLRDSFPLSARRTSPSTSASTTSSPDSMISSVRFSRSSRSSSISSVASSNCALPPPRMLAMQATKRCANLQLNGAKGLYRTDAFRACGPGLPTPALPTPSYEATSALHSMALNSGRYLPSPPHTAVASPTNSLGKRSRRDSIDSTASSAASIQCSVRAMLAECSEEPGRVLRDLNTADSFMLRTEGARLVSSGLATKENGRPLPRAYHSENVTGTALPSPVKRARIFGEHVKRDTIPGGCTFGGAFKPGKPLAWNTFLE